MTTSHDEFDQLAAEWQDIDPPGPPPDAIQRYVRTRTRALRLWAAGELLVGVVALPVLIRLAWTAREAGDRLAMSSLAIVTIAAMLAGWWNWAGVLHATARSTSEFIDLSQQRLRRMRRAYWAGWLLLLAEVAVFSVWIPHRLGAGGTDSPALAWGLLGVMAVSAAIVLRAWHRWLTRDERRLAEWRRELDVELGTRG